MDEQTHRRTVKPTKVDKQKNGQPHQKQCTGTPTPRVDIILWIWYHFTIPFNLDVQLIIYFRGLKADLHVEIP